MSSRSVSLFHVAFAMFLLLAAVPASALDIVINNGFAPPNPANVIDYDLYHQSDSVYVRNVGCGTPNPSSPCPSPGASTEVAVVANGWAYLMYAFDSSSITVSGGDGGDMQAHDSSNITISGGGAQSLEAYDSSSITMSGYSMHLHANDFSNITMNDGQTASLVTRGSSTATLSGGDAGFLNAYDSSSITVSGGWTEFLHADDSSTLTIVGYNFAVDGSPVPSGDLAALTGTLTGTLDSGDSLNSVFYQGGYDGGTWQATGTIRLVPEPSTALLLALGLAGLAVGRRRSAAGSHYPRLSGES